MQLFEPLKEIINRNAVTLDRRMCGIEDRLRDIAESTRATQMLNQREHRYVNKADPVLRNDTGYGWLVRWVAGVFPYDAGGASIFFGEGTHPSGYLGYLGENGEDTYIMSELVDWYVPPGAALTVDFEQEEVEGYVTFQIELLPVPAAPATTGSSGEHIDVFVKPMQPDANVLNDEVANG